MGLFSWRFMIGSFVFTTGSLVEQSTHTYRNSCRRRRRSPDGRDPFHSSDPGASPPCRTRAEHTHVAPPAQMEAGISEENGETRMSLENRLSTGWYCPARLSWLGSHASLVRGVHDMNRPADAHRPVGPSRSSAMCSPRSWVSKALSTPAWRRSIVRNPDRQSPDWPSRSPSAIA